MPSQPNRDLETFPTPPGKFIDRIECPEFTCLCPRTGQPDFAKLTIWYRPGPKCVELKSLKLYLWSFREVGAFHERVTNEILADLVAVLSPKWMFIEGNFWVRGGIHTVVFAEHGPVPEGLSALRMAETSYSPI